MAQLKQLVEYIAQSIVTHPNEVVVTEVENEQGRVFITLQVHPEDKGKVIGRQGRVAQSIRSLLRVAAVKNGVHANLDID
ncbi:MAG: KH domain-containing protein [Chloroflexota bacterium]|nr:KH domain-containing protein [Chloroflexota bacterium]